MSKGKIDDKTKRRAIAEYHKTGNASAIARKYGVARSTFLAWLPALTNTIKTDSPEATDAVVLAAGKISDAAVFSIEQAAATRQEFLQQHYAEIGKLFSALVKKMADTINDENAKPSLRDQAAAFTALTNFVKEFTPTEEQGSVQVNLLQQTVNK